MKNKWMAFAACVVGFGWMANATAATVSGELRIWHKVTINCAGPSTSESAETNPFRDYRLNVSFHHPASGTRYTIPGFFAADGNAANSSATSGNQWKARFRPDQTGAWNYTVSFRTGADVAMKLDSDDSGSIAWAPLNGERGSFHIAASDKSMPDARAPELGRVVYDGSHYLKYAGSGKPYLKGGEGSPENFLGYYEFDQTSDARDTGFDDGLENGIHRYNGHLSDYAAGDPTWSDGKGKRIIGVVNYLASQGLNSMYFLSNNIGPKDAPGKGSHENARGCGDGGDTWPWTSSTERLRFDVSKLEQWDIVLTHMNNKGIGLTWMLAEAENEEALDGDATTALGPERKLYYREMVARFGHHLNIMWIIAEETGTYSPAGQPARNKARMTRIHDLDPYDHPVGLHNGKVKLADYGGFTDMEYYSYQSHDATLADIYPDQLRLWAGSDSLASKWVIMNDEQGKGYSGVGTNTENWDPGFAVTRKDALWGTFMAGGTGVSWYHGGKYPQGDGNCEDFTQRSDLFQQMRHALDFLRDHEVPVHEMRPRRDLLVAAENRRCLAKAGQVYLIQLAKGSDSASIKLDGCSGAFDVTWFDPRNGGTYKGSTRTVQGGAERSVGAPPNAASSDWIVLVEKNVEGEVEPTASLTSSANGAD